MPDHRRQYRRTTVTAALAAVIGFAVLVWLLGAGIVAWGTESPGGWILSVAAGLVSLGGTLLAILAFAGGMISLRRDSLESRGLPYSAHRPGERRAGPLAHGISVARRAWDAARGGRPGRLHLVPGELVEVRLLEEIMGTLDEGGKRDALPFMPEMALWCGRQARVQRRVDKIYDWIIIKGLRRMRDTVFLEGARCDGYAHDGCQADCQILWKEIWLRRVGGRGTRFERAGEARKPGLDLDRLASRTDADTAAPRYICQMTELPKATAPISWNDPRHYLRDLLSGNVRPGPFWTGLAIRIFNIAQRRSGRVQFPMRDHGGSPMTKTTASLDLRPGELARVKSKREIEATLDENFRNRGLWFDPDMMRFCGGEYRVLKRVSRQIEEKSGKMLSFASPAIVLEDVTATGEYLAFALLNERIYWREIWLERVTSPAKSGNGP
jgi:hypothetical protein